MAKYTGQLLTATYNSGAWAANYLRSVTVENTESVVQSTGAADTAETYLAVLEDGTATMEFISDSSNTTIASVFQPGTSSTLTVYPNGNTTGKQSIAGTAIVTSLSQVTTYNELALTTVNLQVTGGLTFANV